MTGLKAKQKEGKETYQHTYSEQSSEQTQGRLCRNTNVKYIIITEHLCSKTLISFLEKFIRWQQQIMSKHCRCQSFSATNSPLQMRPSLVIACLHISQLLAFLNGFSLKVCVWTPSRSSGCGKERKEERKIRRESAGLMPAGLQPTVTHLGFNNNICVYGWTWEFKLRFW